jgi:DNA-binding transcriptional MocR family regulator
MKKIEIIWRKMLFEAINKSRREFTQKSLAEEFGYSTSTVSQAIKPLRQMGAVRVGGRSFVLEDPEKVLYHWASARSFKKDFLLSGHVEMEPVEIEGLAPAEVVFGGYSAACRYLSEAPADYDKVYFYVKDVKSILQRYNLTKGRPNLFIFKADEFLSQYGGLTTLAQTFVDLWNMEDWYAKDFTKELKKKIDELLS